MPFHTLRLGRVGGCVVQIHWSASFIVVALTATAALAVLPPAAPGHAETTYWLVSLAAAAVFVMTLVVHELAHVLVARRYGLHASSVTVWALGGVTLVDGEPHEPRADFRLAAVGPLASAVVAVAAVSGAVQAHAFGASALVVSAFVWVGVANVFVAVFSMLPAAPLDGYRMLRAAVWRLRGRPYAERVATWVGRALGALLVCVGAVDLVLFRQLGGLPLVLLGCFFVGIGWYERATADRPDRPTRPLVTRE